MLGCVYVCRLGSGISSGELRATKCFLLQVSADFTYIHICSVVSKLEPNSTCRGRNSIQSKLPSFYRDVAARLSLNMYPNASAGNVATVLINNITTQHCELGGEVLQAGEGEQQRISIFWGQEIITRAPFKLPRFTYVKLSHPLYSTANRPLHHLVAQN